MTRIAVVGHSHVGALKLGWDQICGDYPDVEMIFFASTGAAARGMGLKDMMFGFHTETPDDDEIIFGNSGARRIDFTTFDHVLFGGRELREDELADVLSVYNIDTAPQADLERRMSLSAFDAILEAFCQTRIKHESWHNWETPRLWIHPQPYPDERCLESGDLKFLSWCVLCADTERLLWMRTRYWQKLTAAFERTGATLLPHPAETLTDVGLTDPAYSLGARRLLDSSIHAQEEYNHMNAEYGVLVMKHFLSRCLAPGRDLKTGT